MLMNFSSLCAKKTWTIFQSKKALPTAEKKLQTYIFILCPAQPATTPAGNFDLNG